MQKSLGVCARRFHFANWDFEGWFNSFKFEQESTFEPTKRLVDPNFGGYSFDHVFRYEYVGEQLWQHGGVRVRARTAQLKLRSNARGNS